MTKRKQEPMNQDDLNDLQEAADWLTDLLNIEHVDVQEVARHTSSDGTTNTLAVVEPKDGETVAQPWKPEHPPATDWYRVSDSLWVDWSESETAFAENGLFYVCDGMGGKALVDVDEIPVLIEALQEVARQYTPEKKE